MRGGERAHGALKVLGVDPGTAVTGWGLIERRDGAVVHLRHGTIRLGARTSLPVKLATIHRELVSHCAQGRPDVVALEKSFVGRNVQSAFRLGEVRGIVMLVAAQARVGVAEYSPAEVKLAIAGTGRAEKTQVERAIVRELGLTGSVAADAADALAVALCHLYSVRMRAVLDAAAPARSGAMEWTA